MASMWSFPGQNDTFGKSRLRQSVMASTMSGRCFTNAVRTAVSSCMINRHNVDALSASFAIRSSTSHWASSNSLCSITNRRSLRDSSLRWTSSPAGTTQTANFQTEASNQDDVAGGNASSLPHGESGTPPAAEGDSAAPTTAGSTVRCGCISLNTVAVTGRFTQLLPVLAPVLM